MARPSAMAVLPTPGSPTRMGLFLVRRLRICRVLRISSSRPITGSNFPCLAISLRFFANLFNALNWVSWVWDETVSPLRNSLMAVINPFSVRPASFNNLEQESLPCTIAINRCSGVIKSSPNIFITLPAFKMTALASLPRACAGSPGVVGNLLIS